MRCTTWTIWLCLWIWVVFVWADNLFLQIILAFFGFWFMFMLAALFWSLDDKEK